MWVAMNTRLALASWVRIWLKMELIISICCFICSCSFSWFPLYTIKAEVHVRYLLASTWPPPYWDCNSAILLARIASSSASSAMFVSPRPSAHINKFSGGALLHAQSVQFLHRVVIFCSNAFWIAAVFCCTRLISMPSRWWRVLKLHRARRLGRTTEIPLLHKSWNGNLRTDGEKSLWDKCQVCNGFGGQLLWSWSYWCQWSTIQGNIWGQNITLFLPKNFFISA